MKALRRIDAKNAQRIVTGGVAAVRGSSRQQNQSATARNLSCLTSSLDLTADSSSTTLHHHDSVVRRRSFSLSTARSEQQQQQQQQHHQMEDPTHATTVDQPPPAADTTSNTPPQQRELLDYKTAKEMTKVLDRDDFHKLGAFSATTWNAVHHMIKSWAEFHTGESVDASFALLERLLREQELLMKNISSVSAGQNGIVKNIPQGEERLKMQQLSREILSTDLLNLIIMNWRECWRSKDCGTTKISSPRDLLPLLEEYIYRSPSLHPDTKTYNVILDSTTSRFRGRVSTQLAIEIFDRMSNGKLPQQSEESVDESSPVLNGGLRCINDTSPNQYSYSTLIKVYSVSKDPKAAEEVLCRFINEFLNGRVQKQPNDIAFSACITAWARSRHPQAPEKCQQIMELMTCLHQQPPLQNVQPTVRTYNALLDCWAKSRRKDAGEKAEAILLQMEQMEGLQPNTISYNTVTYAHEQADGNMDRSQQVFTRMLQRSQQRQQQQQQQQQQQVELSPKPTRDSYMLMLRGISRHCRSDRSAAEKAEDYLHQMLEAGHQPCQDAYNCVLSCWAQSGNKRMKGERAEELLHFMKNPPPNFAIKPVTPNTMTYNSVINACKNQPQKAETYFWAMYNERSSGNRQVMPQVRTFNIVLAAWKNFPGISDKDRLRHIVRMFQQVPKSGALAIKPDIVSCNTLLQALSEMGTEENRVHAAQVLDELEREYKTSKDKSIQPDIMTYTSVMKAHANLGDVHATRTVLNRMLEDYKTGNEKARPDIVPFNNMLRAISRGARGRNLGAGALAEKVFQQVYDLNAAGIMDELPDQVSYHLKINCWANSGSYHAGEEADRIVDEMTEKAANGFPSLQPDERTLHAAMNAHAKCGNYVAAEDYFRTMLDAYSKGEANMKPSLRTINTVLAGCANAKEPQAAEKAEAYLREMLLFRGFSQLELEPNAITFTTVLLAWANSGDERAGERALSLFREIDLLSRKAGSTMHLDNGFYRAVLEACAVSGDTRTAEELLEKINSNEVKGVRADRRMYHALLKAYANSGAKDVAEKAESVLREMQERATSSSSRFMKPDLECYMTLLECWGNSEHHEKAVERSEALLLEMEREGARDARMKPSPAAYSRVINTMARVGDMKRTKSLLKRMYENNNSNDSSVEAFPAIEVV